jgi:hypothetical protein
MCVLATLILILAAGIVVLAVRRWLGILATAAPIAAEPVPAVEPATPE